MSVSASRFLDDERLRIESIQQWMMRVLGGDNDFSERVGDHAVRSDDRYADIVGHGVTGSAIDQRIDQLIVMLSP